MEKVTIVRVILLFGIVCSICACSISKVTKAPAGKFVTNDMYVSGNDTLFVQYDTARNRVEVFTKDYHTQKDSIDRLWVEQYKDPRMQEIAAANVKIIKPTMAEFRKNGISMLSEKALSSVFSAENLHGRFSVYMIYSLTTDDFQDYGFALSWYNLEISLSEEDVESVLNMIRNLQFQYKGDSMAIDKICLRLSLPIRAEK